MPKTITLAVIIIVALLILLGLGRQIAGALEAGKRLDQAAAELIALREQNSQLKQKLTQVSSSDFKEQILRDKLNMARPNETITIIPAELIEKVLGAQKKVEEVKLPNWQGWLKLFLH